jgi:hypothetical protein
MFMYKFVFATVLLSAPDGEELPKANHLHAWLGSAVQGVAISWELLDPREFRLLGHEAVDFARDLKILQGRYQELAGAPLLEECDRFPEREVIRALIKSNRAYRNDLDHQLALDRLHTEDLRAAILETDQLHRVWEALLDARSDYYHTTVRRQSLKHLRDMVGAESFYSGQLPPHVPVWRFPDR